MRLLLASLLGAGGLLASCGSSTGLDDGERPDAPAPMDARPMDADEPVDVGPPRVDGAPGTDARGDGARPVDDPGWRLVEGLPAICEIEIAAHPERALPPLRWQECPDVPGCRELVIDWPDNTPHLRFAVLTNWTVAGGSLYFVYSRAWRTEGRDGRPRDFAYGAIVDERGAHLAVTRTPHPLPGQRELCDGGPMGPAGPQGYWFDAAYIRDILDPTGLIDRFLARASYDAPAELARTWRGTEPTATGLLQEFDAAWPAAMLRDVRGSDVVRVLPSGEVTRLRGPSAENDVLPDGTMLMETPGNETGFQAVRLGEVEPRVLVGLGDADAVAMARTDGVDLAWLQAYGPHPGRPYDRYELWTSPWADDAAGIVPRRVGPLGGFEILSMGSGHVALSGHERGTMLVTELRTGARRRFRYPAGTAYWPLGGGTGGPMLTEDEFVIFLTPDPPDPDEDPVGEVTRMLWIRYDALPLE